MSDITKIKINQLQPGTIELSSLIMFGVGDEIQTTSLSDALDLITVGDPNVRPRLIDYNVTVLEANLLSFLNSVNITIASGESVYIRFFLIKSNGLLYRQTYQIPLSTGVYNPLSSFVDFDSLILINSENLAVQSDANTVTYSFDNLGQLNVSDPAIDFSDSEKVYIVVLSAIPYLFIGDLGFYGDGELTMTFDDLQILSFGTGINSVTGNLVNNDDPNNPVVNAIPQSVLTIPATYEADLGVASFSLVTPEVVATYISSLDTPIGENTLVKVKVTADTPDARAMFFDLQPYRANTNLVEIGDFVSSGDEGFGGTSSVPNLQQVTDAGFITTNPLLVANETEPTVSAFDDIDAPTKVSQIGNDATDPYLLLFKNGAGIYLKQHPQQDDEEGNYEAYLPKNGGQILSSIEITTNFIAQNEIFYKTNGTLTITDPTPEANKGYIVYVIGGTTTINGVGYTAGNLVYRFYNGTAWVSQLINSSLGFTPENVANKATNLTSPDNTKYPTTQAVVNELNLYEKFLISKPVGVYGTVTGTTAETVILSIPFSGGEFVIGDYLAFDMWTTKTGVAAATAITVRAGTTGTTSDSILTLLQGHITGQSSAASRRDGIIFETGNFINARTRSVANATSVDLGSFVNSTRFSLNPSSAWFLTFTVTHTNSADEISVTTYSVSKRKSF